MSANLILSCTYWMDSQALRTWKSFFIVYGISAFNTIILNMLTYYLWTIGLKFHPPLPYGGCSIRLIIFHIMVLILWFQFPKTHRGRKSFRKSLKYYYFSELVFLSVFWVYLLLGKLLLSIPSTYQWLMAISLPFLRDIICRIVLKINYEIAKERDPLFNITSLHAIRSRHKIFISVAISSILRSETGYLLLGIDFFINILLCMKIILDRWKTGNIDVENHGILHGLALNQRINMVVPALYWICFCIAYYGPNGGLIGSVKNSSWHFKSVDNITEASLKMLILFAINISGAIICATLLWISFKISLLRAYVNIQDRFWLIMAAQETYLILEVLLISIIP